MTQHNPETEAVELMRDHENNHPMIGSLIGNRSLEIIEVEIDKPETIERLEREYRASQFIRSWYMQPDLSPLDRSLAALYAPMHAVESVGNQFAKKIVPCFLETDVGTGLRKFREISPNTTDEELALLINDEQFGYLHQSLNEHIEESQNDIEASVHENIERMKKTDSYQFSNNAPRSLEKVLNEGMVISIDPANQSTIKESGTIAGSEIIKLTEYLKNERILGVSGFMGSKISLAVHDFMDHVWTFDMLKKTGLLEKFSGLFDSVGNPEMTDIFKREGEMVASIAFGVRYFQTMPSAFGPIIRSSRLEEMLDEYFVEGRLDALNMDAYRTIKSLKKGSMEWQSLGFTFSNYITELDEQRRKFGTIKQRDNKTRKIIGELDPFDPDYLSFFIETHHQILSSKNKHRNDLFRFHILLEEYLSSYANDRIPVDQPLTLKLDELRAIDFNQTTLPPQRIQWMNRNYGFTATRDAII